MRISKLTKRGFTLVELMIVVAIIGVLAALAIYGVRKYLLNAKTTEAKEGVGRLAKDAASAYDREGMAANVLGLGGTTGIIHHLCVSTPNTVPSGKTSIKGQKYQSNPSEWTTVGWACLKFSMKDPQYYMYNYAATGTTGNAGEIFTARANGDLNGDSTTSDFMLLGQIQSSTVGGLVLTVAPNFSEVNPEE